MNKVSIVRAIVKLYFLGALTGSFIHIVTASHKLGGYGAEAFAVPFMIDGIAVIGMIMRSADFSKRTNKIGFRVQCVMGVFSLAMNVYAAHNRFGVLFGIAIVVLFVFAEWLSDQIESNEADVQLAAAAEAQRIADEAAKKADRYRRAAETRKRNAAKKARDRKAQEKALESLIA